MTRLPGGQVLSSQISTAAQKWREAAAEAQNQKQPYLDWLDQQTAYDVWQAGLKLKKALRQVMPAPLLAA